MKLLFTGKVYILLMLYRPCSLGDLHGVAVSRQLHGSVVAVISPLPGAVDFLGDAARHSRMGSSDRMSSAGRWVSVDAAPLHVAASLGSSGTAITYVASGGLFGLLALQDRMLRLEKASLYERGLLFKSQISTTIVVRASLCATLQLFVLKDV